METIERSTLSVRIRGDIKADAKELAQEEHRSLSNFIEFLILQWKKNKQKEDETLLSKEEYFEMLNSSMEQIKNGKCKRFNSALDLDKHIKGLL